MWSAVLGRRYNVRIEQQKRLRFAAIVVDPPFRDPGRDGMGSGSTKLGKTQKSKNSQAQLHAQPIQSHSRTSHSLPPDPPPPQPAIVSSQPHSIPPIHQMNRNPPSDTCITVECDVTVMEDSGTQTSSDPHFPIVPSSASVHVQHGVHALAPFRCSLLRDSENLCLDLSALFRNDPDRFDLGYGMD